MREAFEKWYMGRNPIAKMDRHGDGYLYASVNQAWSAWQACAKHYEADKARLVEMLKMWHGLINYQYTGSNEAISNLQDCAFLTVKLLAEMKGGK